jgi:hypothetical protein
MGNFFQGAAGASRTQAGSPIYMPGLVANDNGYKQTPMPQYSGVNPSLALATSGYGGSVLPGGALGDQIAGSAAPAAAPVTAPGAMQPRPTLTPTPAPAAAFGGRSIYG